MSSLVHMVGSTVCFFVGLIMVYLGYLSALDIDTMSELTMVTMVLVGCTFVCAGLGGFMMFYGSISFLGGD